MCEEPFACGRITFKMYTDCQHKLAYLITHRLLEEKPPHEHYATSGYMRQNRDNSIYFVITCLLIHSSNCMRRYRANREAEIVNARRTSAFGFGGSINIRRDSASSKASRQVNGTHGSMKW